MPLKVDWDVLDVPFEAQQPQWPAPSGVRAVFTGRRFAGQADEQQGRSHFNLGAHVGDDPAQVADRRALVDASLGMQAIYVNQVHGTAVCALDALPPHSLADADAVWASRPGVACAIMVADCLPVLMCNRQGSWVGAAHAGWRGLAGHVGQAGVLETLTQAYVADTTALARGEHRSASDLMAWLGPCIGPTAFEVGPEVKAAFESPWAQPPTQALVHCATPANPQTMPSPHRQTQLAQVQAQFIGQRDGKFLANLPGLARLRLQAVGVSDVHGNDGAARWCTVSNPERYFSYRRDQARLGASGRMCAYIWLV